MRSNTRIIACCIAALILFILPVTGLNVTISVHPDGKWYDAEVILNDTSRYELFQSGMLGERIPLEVSNLTLSGKEGDIEPKNERGTLSFPEGNYTLHYQTTINGNSLQVQFPEPANTTLLLPQPYQVGNPLLTSLQPSGNSVRSENNSTSIHWNNARYVDVRFYDKGQEELLFLFGQFWLIIAVMMLLPFFYSRKR